jgi:hypothetical protein
MLSLRTRARALAFAGAASLFIPIEVLAHCYVGSRFLPATLTSEDPCVADELSLPTVSRFRNPASGDDPAVRETTIAFDFAKRITPELGFSVGRTYLMQKPDGLPRVSGWDNLEVGLKYQVFTVPAREFVLSVGLDVDLGGTGARRVGAESFSTLTPAIYFGKGFGDLPDSVALLRPFALTGAVGYGIPSRSSTLLDPDTGEREWNPHTLVAGFSLQYSLPYLQQNVRDTGLGAIANHLIPLVELSLVTPLDRGQSGLTVGTVNPGFIWADKYFQVGFELLIPVNSRSGNHVGFLGQLHFYLDDIAPKTFGRPLFEARR